MRISPLFIRIVLTLAMVLALIASDSIADDQTVASDHANSGASVSAVTDIAVLPASIELHGSEAIQRVSVVRLRDGKPAGVVESDLVSFHIDDPTIASQRGNVISAVTAGETELVCRLGKDSVRVPIKVQMDSPDHRWDFRNEVQSVLAKRGCNMGACHGALAGKGGFRLSLRGYDSDFDFHSISREARGRRIELADPGRSLLLAKPTGALPHKGGLKLDVASRDYRVLAEWVSQGAQGPGENDARLEQIRVLPENAKLQPGETFQVLVHAHYDDGRVVDVTHWAIFSATDESVASVDEDGLATIRGSGEAAILVWFGSQVALARMTVPFDNVVDDQVYETAEQRNFIDTHNLTQLRTLRLEPSPNCDDETFLRRSSLDTIGRLPTLEERSVYFATPAVDRREHWIERLLSSQDFVSYWSYKWSDLLLISGTRLRPTAVKSYYGWVRERIRQNQPWDDFVREILTATGRSDQNGATNFYALHQSPEEMTENACQAFMGLSIGCAKCHNHPLEKWTNDQYYSMANLFARVRAKGWGGDSRNGDGIRTLFVASSGELLQPNRGRPQPPAPLDAEPIPFDFEGDRRQVLADWMTSPENPYFARSISNRLWANFFGRGLVEQVDDLRLSNPASNEPLLDALCDHLIEADFDLKHLMRAILQSATYQRSSTTLKTNEAESRYHSRYYPKRLMAEVMLDSIDQVLGTTTVFNEVAFRGSDRQKTDFYQEGTKAIELYDSAVNSYFLKTFGRNPREITCECERTDEPSMVQVLHLSNGETLNSKLAAPKSFLSEAIASGATDDEILRALFMRALQREPLSSEVTRLRTIIKEYDDRRTALEDVAWSVLTSTEFVFNH
ncbi:MAG: DUF1549 and DUF1553 domain-containing protein [Planctomycetota bacterium]